MSTHMVPEEWHIMETEKFVRRVFESDPKSEVAHTFPTYVRGNMPIFMPHIAQYALEKSRPVWLVAFYGEPKEKHVGGYLDEDGFAQQIHSIDPDYIEIGAVKLPVEPDVEADAVVGRAVRVLRDTQYCCSWRVQTDEADAFHISNEGNLTARRLREGRVVEGPVLLGNFLLDDKTVLGKAADQLPHPCLC
ncbi:MAG: hypothetical protein WC613_01890 [Candidatus Aenigmatarchaeota archaeon]